MSPDPVEALKAFEQKYALGLRFLSDTHHDTIEAYGGWGERPDRGPGVIRSTVLIGKDGRIERTWYGVKPDGHAEEVLGSL